ncbi:MAG: CoA-acylating methylmalonate-semialdehyde dehydrogenase [Chloroflexi bacterium]|nr:CoA-acylating methylmalonate-semialdehyde dehydrogenase [Chloroflexota bacterium]
MKHGVLTNYIDGKYAEHRGDFIDVYSPVDGSIIAKSPLSTYDELDSAVKKAREAFPGWAAVPIKERVQVFYRYKALLEENLEDLAKTASEECGKTIGESIASVQKAIEVVEFACSLPQIIAGEILEVSSGVECRIDKYPLGVVASIAPFNFPVMVPHWTMPNAVALGNCMILKPSELVPVSSMKIAALLKQAGLPDGVFNIIHGSREIVEGICDHPGIEAVSFVGSTKVAKIVYVRATSNLKRALCLGGAKNYLIVTPDANPDMTGSNVAASMSGCAGQRCMAAAVMIAVGDVDHIIKKLVAEAEKIVPGKNLGAVITREAKERIESYITGAEKAGAKILVDGRGAVVPGKENGYYVGATVIDHVTPDMKAATEEIFGPVISIIRAKNLDEAIAIENASNYGNAASVFTQSGLIAREVYKRASAGMIGVNIGVPVPREPFSFGGWNESKFGVGDITGKSSVEFWTKPKKTTVKWNAEAKCNWMS